jgi:hypothetical protein
VAVFGKFQAQRAETRQPRPKAWVSDMIMTAQP